MFWFLFIFCSFSEEYGRAAMEERQYRYNLIPFVEIRRFWIYRKQLGCYGGSYQSFWKCNWLYSIWIYTSGYSGHKCRNGLLIVLAGFSLSLLVEVMQLITKVGCFDVDDMILNTAGAAIGYLLFVVCNYLRRKRFMAKRYRYAIIKKKEAQKGSCQWGWQLLHWFYL